MPSPLAEAHIVAQQRLRALLARAVAATWQGLPGYDEIDVGPWLDRVVPIVLAAQRQSAALTDAYVARLLGRQPLGVSSDAVTGAAVRGVPPQDVYRRPFVTVWTALAAGTEWQQAVNAGLARATSTAEMDVQMASFKTYQAVQDADPRIRGYQRVADGGACAFCRTINGAFVKSADAAPLHNRCGCGLEPVLHDVTPTPLPDGVAVHHHGELGAVLGDPAHDFTAL